MDEKTKQKIEEIRKRLLEYLEERECPYRTEKTVLDAIWKFLEHAPEDIGFLLNEVKQLSKK